MTEPGRIFVFEYLTSGGLFLDGVPPTSCPSLVTEGSAMRNALVEDLLDAGCAITILSDDRLATLAPDSSVNALSVGDPQSFHEQFSAALTTCAQAWIIAPEIGGAHLELTARAEARCPVVSPGSTLVRLATDKHETAEFLQRAGISTPPGTLRRSPNLDAPSTGQFIIKPNDGAGSLGVRLVQLNQGDSPEPSGDELSGDELSGDELSGDNRVRIERYIEGPAFSVGVLGCPSGFLVLEPCRQHLSNDGLFAYQGGQMPIESAEVRSKIFEIAGRVARALPRWHGFVGIDIVCGTDEPFVIEINPRLTTSYVGLRSWFDQNLAKIVLDSKHGAVESLSAGKFQLQFDPYGRVNKASHREIGAALKYDWQGWQSY